MRAVQTGGSGSINLHDVKAGNFSATHNGSGDIHVENIYAHGQGSVQHNGAGDIHLDKMEAGNIARVQHNGTGEIVAPQVTAGQEAHFLNRNGGMDLGIIDGGRRLTIFDLFRQAKVRANLLKASELITILSLHYEINRFETPTLLDLLLAGDQTRRAVGWQGAGEVGSLFESYRRRYDSLDGDPFIDLRSWRRTLDEVILANETDEETITIAEDA